MKIDHQLAERWIKPNAKVLDLGCGNGDLLAHLQNKLGVFGYGIEIDQTKINDCVTKGVNVIEQDLNDGLARFCRRKLWHGGDGARPTSGQGPTNSSSTWYVLAKKWLSLSLILRIGKTVFTWVSKAWCQCLKPCRLLGTTRPIFTCVPLKTLKSCVMTMTSASSIVLRYKKVKSPTTLRHWRKSSAKPQLTCRCGNLSCYQKLSCFIADSMPMKFGQRINYRLI